MKEQATVYRAGCPVRVVDGKPYHIDWWGACRSEINRMTPEAPWAQRTIS